MDIEALAREAGFPMSVVDTLPPVYYLMDPSLREPLARFAALVVERALTIDDREIRRILGSDGKYGVTEGEVIDVQRVLEARRAAFPMPKGGDQPRYVAQWLTGPRPPEPLGPDDLGVVVPKG